MSNEELNQQLYEKLRLLHLELESYSEKHVGALVHR